MARTAEERVDARARGSHEARLQHPHIDLTRCMGCGLCVAACPEEGVLDVLHGQARVVHGARCVGHGRCAEVCPVDAIAVALGDVSERTDLPALEDDFEAIGTPGLFLAGEVTGFALVRTAIAQGTAVAREVARRRAGEPPRSEADTLDLVVVGCGPAGIACSLATHEADLAFEAIDQDRFGGTVAHYPRQKLVMTQPVELPVHGKLERTTYTKEELIELWRDVAERHHLPLSEGERLTAISRDLDGALRVHTDRGERRAWNVCLALGRRGTPRKLGAPGEERCKVTYDLVDARAFAGQDVLVVGGGDSAIEAAVGLSLQPDTRVTLSYRKDAFFRLKARNEAAVRDAEADGAIDVRYGSSVARIDEGSVTLDTPDGPVELRNDHVFVFAGGIPPFKLLEDCGVSFDPSLRRPVELPGERGSGLARALAWALFLCLAVLAWTLLHRGYYDAPVHARGDLDGHAWLRPARGVGLAAGIAAVAAVALNLAYLLRRARRGPLRFGSLRVWMTAHVATGIGAFLMAAVHGGFVVRDTAGGHAILAMGVLVTTGAIGRYLYAFVPRAANGRELHLEEVQARLAGLDGEWEADHPEFRARARDEVARLTAEGHWSRSLWRRIAAAVGAERRLRVALDALREEGAREGVPAARVADVLALARRAHRVSLAAARYEDLRGMLAGWRYLHRWVALLFVLLLGVHVVAALRYADLGGLLSGGTP